MLLIVFSVQATAQALIPLADSRIFLPNAEMRRYSREKAHLHGPVHTIETNDENPRLHTGRYGYNRRGDPSSLRHPSKYIRTVWEYDENEQTASTRTYHDSVATGNREYKESILASETIVQYDDHGLMLTQRREEYYAGNFPDQVIGGNTDTLDFGTMYRKDYITYSYDDHGHFVAEQGLYNGDFQYRNEYHYSGDSVDVWQCTRESSDTVNWLTRRVWLDSNEEIRKVSAFKHPNSRFDTTSDTLDYYLLRTVDTVYSPDLGETIRLLTDSSFFSSGQLRRIVVYHYSLEGRIAEQSSYDPEDGSSWRSRYRYNAMGDLERFEQEQCTVEDGQQRCKVNQWVNIRYEYDEHGNWILKEMMSPSNRPDRWGGIRNTRPMVTITTRRKISYYE